MNALFICLALVASPQPGTILIDQIVAVVDGEVLTQSELFNQARVKLVFDGQRQQLQLLAQTGDVLLAERLRREILDQLTQGIAADTFEALRQDIINHLLIANYVRRIDAAPVSEMEVQTALAAFQRAFGSAAGYDAFKRRFDLSDEFVRGLLERYLRNAKYVAVRMRSWGAGTENPQERQQKQSEALGAWIEELRRTADIRLLGQEGLLERQ